MLWKYIDKDEPKYWVQSKRQQPPLATTPRSGRDAISFLTGSMATSSLQVSLDSGPSFNDIFVDKTDGKGSRLDVYCFFLEFRLGYLENKNLL